MNGMDGQDSYQVYVYLAIYLQNCIHVVNRLDIFIYVWNKVLLHFYLTSNMASDPALWF